MLFGRGLFWNFWFKNKTFNTIIYNMSKELFIIKPYIKSKTVSEDCPTCCPCCSENIIIPSFTYWILLCPKFKEFRLQLIQFVNEISINFSLIVNKKSLSIPNFQKGRF